ncbi:MAG: ParB/RepB/Spo0J family partition protein [Candidatus Moraniibacteriota bacterium]
MNTNTNLKVVNVKEIFPSKTNVNGRVKGEEFDELVASIREKGILTPILVRPGNEISVWTDTKRTRETQS